jgi:hypothetical protein
VILQFNDPNVNWIYSAIFFCEIELFCASLWNDKKCFDTVDARYKHEES